MDELRFLNKIAHNFDEEIGLYRVAQQGGKMT